jgi:hypothetical protein
LELCEKRLDIFGLGCWDGGGLISEQR